MSNSKRGGGDKIPDSMKTTPQVAAEIGVAESTVRGWLSRHTCFIEGHHYIKEESGRTLWLPAGVEFLKAGEFNTTETETKDDGDEIIDPILEATAQKLAYRYFEKLPQKVVERIRQILQNPTDDDRAMMINVAQKALQNGAIHLIRDTTPRSLNG